MGDAAHTNAVVTDPVGIEGASISVYGQRADGVPGKAANAKLAKPKKKKQKKHKKNHK